MYNCNCRINCTFLAVVASIIIGIITAFLRISATITVTAPFLWVVFGIAVVYLAILLLAVTLTNGFGTRICICPILSVLITAILLTILASVILLAIEFVATSVIGAIITGLLLAFLTLTLTSTACLIRCLLSCNN